MRIEEFGHQHQDYLSDESKKIGTAASISFPITEEEVSAAVSYFGKQGSSITVQGARTGITAGAVPLGGHVLNLGRMDAVTGLSYDAGGDRFLISVQPGMTLSRLRELVKSKALPTDRFSQASQEALKAFKAAGQWFFPPDPTEATATLGGMAACNASGACSYSYGPTRDHIEALSLVLADGSVLRLRRGECMASGMSFSVTSDSGRVYKGSLPDYEMPAVKNASGYYAKEGMDLIDLFIGSEGTLGIITELTLRLVKCPSAIWGMTAFFPGEDQALKFVKEVRGGDRTAAIEFFNRDTLALLSQFRSMNTSFSEVPDVPYGNSTAIYLEFHCSDEAEADRMAMDAAELMERCGGDPEAAWLATGPREMERLKAFRHAVPEAVNLTIAGRKSKNPDMTKLGTDMAVPDGRLPEMMETYNRGLSEEGLESVIFGHIGNNHVHVNILPRTMEEYETGWKLYHSWARKVIGIGGTISAEHGVGKLKVSLLEEMYGPKGISEMREVKKLFDPGGMLNRGNLFI